MFIQVDVDPFWKNNDLNVVVLGKVNAGHDMAGTK